MNGDRAALVLMVGAPGSGKSTWAAERFTPDLLFSLDMFRRMITGAELDMEATPAAKSMLTTLVDDRMRCRLTTVVDSTNTRTAYREPLIRSARERGMPVVAVRMHTPLGECIRRQATRTPAYPGCNATAVLPHIVRRLWLEVEAEPPTVGEVDAVVHVGGDLFRYADGSRADGLWRGRLPEDVTRSAWLHGYPQVVVS